MGTISPDAGTPVLDIDKYFGVWSQEPSEKEKGKKKREEERKS